LNVPRPVEAESALQCSHGLIRSVLAQDHHGGVSRQNHRDRENREGHDKKYQDYRQKTPDKVT
jgi:hypothetical protein